MRVELLVNSVLELNFLPQRSSMKRDIAVLQLENNPNYEKNLDKIKEYLKSLSTNAIIVAPEVCLTDYDYDNLQKACDFSEVALKELTSLVDNQIVALSILRKINNIFVNQAVVLHKGRVVHTQNKHKLFKLGDEHKFLEAGSAKDIKVFEVDGIKLGLLICFELRYKELWQKLEGADVILVPSQWGLARKRHLEIISNSLAVINQCYVAVANSSKVDMASSSAIYAPMGGIVIDDASECIQSIVDFKQIKFMRRYLKLN